MTPVPGGFACLTFRKTWERSSACRAYVTIREIGWAAAIVGTGAMTIFDYVAIGALIVLGVFAVTVVSGGRFKL